MSESDSDMDYYDNDYINKNFVPCMFSDFKLKLNKKVRGDNLFTTDVFYCYTDLFKEMLKTYKYVYRVKMAGTEGVSSANYNHTFYSNIVVPYEMCLSTDFMLSESEIAYIKKIDNDMSIYSNFIAKT